MATNPGKPPTALDAHALALAASRAAGGGIYLGQSRSGAAFAPAEDCVLVVGPPRAGKTGGIVVPNVVAACGSVLVASTKPDVLLECAAARRRLGPCMLYDPSGKVQAPAGVDRVGWSPLRSSTRWDTALLTATAMAGAARPGADRGEAAHWTERATALLAAVMHAAALEESGLETVVSWVNTHDGDRPLAILARREAQLPLDLLEGIVRRTVAREQSGIWSTASSVLSGYRTEAALESARGRLVDVEDLAQSTATLFVVSGSEHQQQAAPLVAGLVRDVRRAVYAHHGDRAPFLLVLDELAGIAPLHDLPDLVREGGSQGLLTLACLQDLSQARGRWGEAADGFLTLFGTKVVLPGIGDTRTLDALSLLAGERDVQRISVTSSAGLLHAPPPSVTRSSEPRRRLPPDLLADAPKGTAVVYVGARPGRLRLTPFHLVEPWRSAVLGGRERAPLRRAEPDRVRDRRQSSDVGLGR